MFLHALTSRSNSSSRIPFQPVQGRFGFAAPQPTLSSSLPPPPPPPLNREDELLLNKSKSSSIADLRLKAKRHQEAMMEIAAMAEKD
jgi:hypothetical protein